MKDSTLKKIQEVFDKNILSLYKYTKFEDTVITVIIIKKIQFEKFDMLRKILKNEYFIFFSEDDMKNGVDVFPLNFLHMKKNSELIMGTDYFKSFKIQKKNLRSSLEHEIRNKLIYLREQFILVKKRRHFLNVIMPTFNIFVEALLFMKNLNSEEDVLNNIKVIEKEYKISLTVFKQLEKEQSFKGADVHKYVQKIHTTLSKLCDTIDALKIK